MGSAARWSADIRYAGPTASSSLVPASLQSSKKETKPGKPSICESNFLLFKISLVFARFSLFWQVSKASVSKARRSHQLQRTPAPALPVFRGHNQGCRCDATKEGRGLYTNMWEQSPGRWAERRFGMEHPKRCFGYRSWIRIAPLSCIVCSAGFRMPHKVQSMTPAGVI